MDFWYAALFSVYTTRENTQLGSIMTQGACYCNVFPLQPQLTYSIQLNARDCS